MVRFGLVLVVLASALPAQQGAAALHKAIVVEEEEHDAAAAARMYEAVAVDESADAAVRVEAWLRLGLLQRALGKEEDAVRALQRAAQGVGDAATRAKAALAHGPRQEELAKQVAELVDRLANLANSVGANIEVSEPALQTLVLLGPAAIPHLAEQIGTGVGHRPLVSAIAIGEIGTAAGADVLRDLWQRPDWQAREAVLHGTSRIPDAQSELRAALIHDLLQHEDPKVRERVITHLGVIVPVPELLARARDEDSTVRAAAFNTIVTLLTKRDALSADQLNGLLPLLRRAIERPALAETQAAMRLLQTKPFLGLAGGRELLLQAMLLPGFEARVQGVPEASMPADAQAEQVATVARRLGAVVSPGNPTPAQRTLLALIEIVVPGWTRASLPHLFTLVELGYGGPGGTPHRRVLRVATADDIPAMLKVVAKQPIAEDWIAWMAEREVPAAASEPLMAWLESRATRASEVTVGSACVALGVTGTEAAARYLVKFAEQRPGLIQSAVAGLMRNEHPIAEAALLDLLVAPAKEGFEAQYRKMRNDVFVHFVRRGTPAAVERFGRAYEAGLESAVVDIERNLGLPVRGLAALDVFYFGAGGQPKQVAINGYDDVATRRIIDTCLATGNRDAWQDTINMARDGKPHVALESLAQHVLEAPSDLRDLVLRDLLGMGANIAKLEQPWSLLIRALRSDDARVRSIALQATDMFTTLPPDVVPALRERLDDPEWAPAAAKALAKVDQKVLYETVPALLRNENSLVRAFGIAHVIGAMPDRALDVLREALRDTSAHVRKEAAVQLGRLTDAAAVPALLDAMRDADAEVRDAARQALEHIRFWHTQKQAWQTLQREDPLAAPNAAAALLEQTKPDQPKAVRVAAVESLGTLAVPETLPFLIRLMQDQDQDVAAAAKAAVAKVNARQR